MQQESHLLLNAAATITCQQHSGSIHLLILQAVQVLTEDSL